MCQLFISEGESEDPEPAPHYNRIGTGIKDRQ